MPVGIRFFFRSMGILLDQVFGIAEIKIPGNMILSPFKNHCLYIQESVQKRSPDRIGASGPAVCPDPDILGDTKKVHSGHCFGPAHYPGSLYLPEPADFRPVVVSNRRIFVKGKNILLM